MTNINVKSKWLVLISLLAAAVSATFVGRMFADPPAKSNSVLLTARPGHCRQRCYQHRRMPRGVSPPVESLHRPERSRRGLQNHTGWCFSGWPHAGHNQQRDGSFSVTLIQISPGATDG
jgi:hypothetical protein